MSRKGNGTSGRHLFLAVNCKTPGCSTANMVKYLGPDTGQTEIGDLVPTGFDFQCSRCAQAHRYLDKDVYPVRLNSGPPPGFENGF